MDRSADLPLRRPDRDPLSARSVSLFSALKPLPELLDMTVLFSELRGLASSGRSPRLLSAAEQGEAILYISANVEVEVEEKFERMAGAARVPVANVRRAWRNRYRPYVRVIDGVPAEHDLRWRELADDDADDLPFAEAVAIMGPILAFSEDADLTGRGLATDQWRDIPELHWRLRGADYTVAVPPTVVIALVIKAIEAARKHPEIALIVVLALAFIFGPTGPERVRLTSDRARAIGRGIANAFVQVAAMRAEVCAQLTARLAPGSSEETLSAIVAELLQEREPVAFEALAGRLALTVSDTELADFLGDWPVFVEIQPGWWQLGRSI